MLKRGGVISVCIARIDDGARKGDLVLRGVKGEDGRFCDREEVSSSSSELCDVRGELCLEGESNTTSSGPLERRAEPEKEASSSRKSSSMQLPDAFGEWEVDLTP